MAESHIDNRALLGHETSHCQSNLSTACRNNISIDDLLSEHVGEFGKGQLKQLLIVGFAWMVESLSTYAMIFSENTPQWECAALPPSASNPSFFFTECSSTADQCQLERYQWDWVGGNNTSIVTQWDLICGNLYKVGLVQSLFFVGNFIGAGIFSYLSDGNLGRKKSLIVACSLSALFNFLTSFSPVYVTYAIFRTLNGVFSGGLGATLFVLIIETIGPSVRGSFTILANSIYVMGILLLPIIAYYSPYWRRLYLIISIVSFIYCFFILPWAFESSRWLLVNGKRKEAMDVLVRIASENGKMIPEDLLLVSDQDQSAAGMRTNEKENEYVQVINLNNPKSDIRPITDASSEKHINSRERITKNESYNANNSVSKLLFASVTRTRLLTVISMWFTVNLVYAGLLLNVNSLGSSIYLNTFINALVQLCAVFVVFVCIDRVGRKNPLHYSLLCSGISCLACSVSVNSSFDDYFPSFTICTISAFIGMFSVTCSFSTLYTFSVELFPTEVRNMALGLVVQIGIFGSVLSPYVVILGNVLAYVPYLVFGTMCLLVLVCVSMLPETHNQVMWETIETLENSFRDFT